jgi:hypothetical protein
MVSLGVGDRDLRYLSACAQTRWADFWICRPFLGRFGLI